MTALLATVYYAVKTVVDPTILPNAGLARPLTVTAPDGTRAELRAPGRGERPRSQTCQRVVDLIHRRAGAGGAGPRDRRAPTAPAPSRPSSAPAEDTGALWVYLETIGGGFGARATKDGLDGVHVHITNTSNLPVEALEIEYPLTLLRYELVDDSGGAGQFRGGMGLRRVYRAEPIAACASTCSRLTSQSWGLLGGGAGGHGAIECGPGVAVRQGQCGAEGRPVVRRGHPRRRRLRPAGPARRRRRGARPGRRRDRAEDGTRHLPLRWVKQGFVWATTKQES